MVASIRHFQNYNKLFFPMFTAVCPPSCSCGFPASPTFSAQGSPMTRLAHAARDGTQATFTPQTGEAVYYLWVVNNGQE